MQSTDNRKRKIKIQAMLVAHPKKYLNWHGKHPSIEDTGKGDTLCYETWGGRLFFSDPGAVKEETQKFVDDYKENCKRSEEDPAGIFFDVANFNDLYSLYGILPTHLGDAWGYNSSVDYAQDIDFAITLVKPGENEIADLFGREVLIIEPSNDESYPNYYYKEL